MDTVRFGKILKELRLDKELGQVALSKVLKCSHGIISEWEAGKKTPSADTLINIAKFFGVTTDYLIGLEDEFGGKV